jgi:putative membrane protein
MGKLRGFLVGAAGGLVGAAAMGPSYRVVAKLMPKSSPPAEDATEKVADAVATKFTGRKLGRIKKKMGGQIVHLAFGASMGALYGLLAERLPAIRAGGGVLLGTSLYLGAHGVTVPALGLAPGPVESGPAQESPEFAAHLVYGFVTETVRRLLS